jgi:hypothetical protein
MTLTYYETVYLAASHRDWHSGIQDRDKKGLPKPPSPIFPFPYLFSTSPHERHAAYYANYYFNECQIRLLRNYVHLIIDALLS